MVDFPKLFDRNFIIGYFLPLAVFLAVGSSFAAIIGVPFDTKEFVKANPFLSGFIIWLGAVLLLGVNRQVVRILEGYGRYNPLRIWRFIEVRRFNSLNKSVETLDQEFLAAGSALEKDRIRAHRRKLLALLAERFPDSAAFLLPTAFGNVLRAFEIYPREIYGFEAICGWSRILAIVPKDFRELIDSAKAQVDFWLNLWALSSIFFVGSFSAIIYLGSWKHIVLIVGSLIVGWISSRCARSSAAQWGEMVKAAFDVFLPALRKQLGFEGSLSRADERKLWVGFSQVMTFRLRDSLPDQPTQDTEKPRLATRLQEWVDAIGRCFFCFL